jgi:hypothetical protein
MPCPALLCIYPNTGLYIITGIVTITGVKLLAAVVYWCVYRLSVRSTDRTAPFVSLLPRM